MEGTKRLSIAVGFGIVALLIFACMTSLFIAILLKFTDINEGVLSIVVMVLAILFMLISGFIAGAKAQGRGWFVGAITGLTFFILVFLINYLGYDKPLSNEQLLYQLALIAASTIGGIFGVNLAKRTY